MPGGAPGEGESRPSVSLEASRQRRKSKEERKQRDYGAPPAAENVFNVVIMFCNLHPSVSTDITNNFVTAAPPAYE